MRKQFRKRGPSQKNFAIIPRANIPRSTFNRDCDYITNIEPGYIYPVFVDADILPGDTVIMKSTIMARLATLWSPIMSNVYVDVHFFFVPFRLLWENWEKFNGYQVDPGDSTDYEIPQIDHTVNIGFESLYDYMGIRPGITYDHNALPMRAYNLIYNDWYRDENLIDSVPVPTDDGPDGSGNYVLLKRGKRHDYFTSCLPWPQKGDAVSLPLGTSAPVISDGTGIPKFEMNSVGNYNLESVGATSGAGWSAAPGATYDASWDDPELKADLQSATAATINELRQAFQLQKLLERDARGGTRYTEVIRAHFGVTSPDHRLQRPEFLGGGTTPLFIHQVENTATVGATHMGDLGAYGQVAQKFRGFAKSFTEHGVIVGLASVRADLHYQQGIERQWSRTTREDFYWPALAHIGEQAVRNDEIFAQGTAADDDAFGYQERYAEYRYKPSLITGQMRSDHGSTLDWWHLAQDFAVLPTLNQTFIEETPPMARVLLSGGVDPSILLNIAHEYRHVRPMPTFSVPGLIDHF